MLDVITASIENSFLTDLLVLNVRKSVLAPHILLVQELVKKNFDCNFQSYEVYLIILHGFQN